MESILRFNTQDVELLMNHCRDAVQHREILSPDDGPNLWLVKDRGIYLMSSGYPRLEINGEHFIANCINCDPDVHDDWWEQGQFLMGGDDVAEPIPLADVIKWLQSAIEAQRHILMIHWQQQSYSLLLHETPGH